MASIKLNGNLNNADKFEIVKGVDGWESRLTVLADINDELSFCFEAILKDDDGDVHNFVVINITQASARDLLLYLAKHLQE